ncbi:hypothetical protein ACWD4L_37680 [Streptomyces sp. NPDC002596]|uniref:hypothetical protein n=1 Tax=Streptomyces sp. NPDC056227 TaxID=3345753 RepID=UPI0035D8084A
MPQPRTWCGGGADAARAVSAGAETPGAVIPLAAYLALQKQFIAGLTTGATK